MAGSGNGDVSIPKILRQLEYYFSDSNLPGDKFLKAKIAENEEGYIDIDVLLTFNRLKMLGATRELVVQATKNSSLLNVDDKGERIKRTTPLPEKSEFYNRAVFLKGWPPRSKEPSIDEIIDLFAPCGKVLRVNIRRFSQDGQKLFRGSITVEMESAEAAERVVADEFKVNITNPKTEEVTERILEAELFSDYAQRMKEKDKYRRGDRDEKNDRKRKRDDQNPKNVKGDDDHMNGKNKNDDSDDDVNDDNDDEQKENGFNKRNNMNNRDNKKPRHDYNANNDDDDDDDDDDHKISTTNGDATKDNANGNHKENTESTHGHKDSEVKKPDEVDFTPGLIMRIEDLTDGTSREDIREVLEEYGEVTFVDFARGNTDGHVRFSQPSDVTIALEKLKAEPKDINGGKPILSILEGDEEREYWINVHAKQDLRRKQFRDRGRNGRGRGRPRGRGRRGRGGSRFRT